MSKEEKDKFLPKENYVNLQLYNYMRHREKYLAGILTNNFANIIEVTNVKPRQGNDATIYKLIKKYYSKYN